jgi:hypothetical protein
MILIEFRELEFLINKVINMVFFFKNKLLDYLKNITKK